MSTPIRRPVASLWIGEKLHYLNQLCLLSHVVQGHPTTLYCTESVSNVPEGVIIKPATDTCYVTEACFRMIVDSAILPEGAAQLVAGGWTGAVIFLDYGKTVAQCLESSPAGTARGHRRGVEYSEHVVAEIGRASCRERV